MARSPPDKKAKKLTRGLPSAVIHRLRPTPPHKLALDRVEKVKIALNNMEDQQQVVRTNIINLAPLPLRDQTQSVKSSKSTDASAPPKRSIIAKLLIAAEALDGYDPGAVGRLERMKRVLRSEQSTEQRMENEHEDRASVDSGGGTGCKRLGSQVAEPTTATLDRARGPRLTKI